MNNKSRVFVIGDLNVDMLLYLKGLPPIGEEKHAKNIEFSVGGNAANFATAMGKMGGIPEFYSCIGNDFSSGYLLKTLRKSGVNARLKEIPSYNGYTAAFVLPDGERTLVSNKGASGAMTVADLDEVLERISPGDIVYVGGLFHLPELSKGFADFLKRAKKRGSVNMLDFTFDSMGCSDCFEDLIPYLDLVFFNEDETKRLGKGDIERSIERISEMGVRKIVTKLGRRGSMYFENGIMEKQPANRVEVKDSTGAGDVFNAGFVLGYMSGLKPVHCLRLGNIAGAYKVCRTGIMVPPKDDITEFIENSIKLNGSV
jgi:sugar/nucleoside kinase (ribokinase family)